MCCRTHTFMGAWIEKNNNVMQRNITNSVVAPVEVCGLKYACIKRRPVQQIIHVSEVREADLPAFVLDDVPESFFFWIFDLSYTRKGQNGALPHTPISI